MTQVNFSFVSLFTLLFSFFLSFSFWFRLKPRLWFFPNPAYRPNPSFVRHNWLVLVASALTENCFSITWHILCESCDFSILEQGEQCAPTNGGRSFIENQWLLLPRTFVILLFECTSRRRIRPVQVIYHRTPPIRTIAGAACAKKKKLVL